MDEALICSVCGETIDPDEARYLDEEPICESCAAQNAVTCCRCGELVWRSDNAGSISVPLCQSDYEAHYCNCSRCDAILELSDALYLEDDDDSPLCSNCYDEALEESQEYIHPYSFKPEPIFYGDGNRYFGIELEIDEAGKSEAHAKCLLEIANAKGEYLYIKTDGSIEDGLELVSHPMTIGYHLHEMPWREILQAAVRMGYHSSMTTTCGLHFHVNRDSLGDSYSEQESTIAKLLYMNERFWNELLVFSRRTEASLRKWARRYQWKEHPRDVLDCAKNSGNGRYSCINLQNRDTAEWRMCKGTLKVQTFFASLQMFDELCKKASFYSEDEIENLCRTDLVKGIDPKEKPELIEYLKIRRLFVNEPVMEGRDW